MLRSLTRPLLLVSLAALLVTPSAIAPVDMFVKIDDIDGESTDDKHEKWIDILSMTWGAHVEPDATALGGGGGAGKVSMQDLHVVKQVDRSTPALLEALTTGEHIEELELVVRKDGGDAEPFYRIKLSKITVTSIQMTASQGDDRPVEEVAFNYARIEMTYEGGAADGGTITYGWDLEANKRV